jgi:hypothetical protein
MRGISLVGYANFEKMALKRLEITGSPSLTYQAPKNKLSRTLLIVAKIVNLCCLMNVIWIV